MIRTEREYKEAKARAADSRARLDLQREQFAAKGYASEQIDRGMASLVVFQQQIEDDIEWYENAKIGRLDVPIDFEHIGRLLISLRIASGVAQAALAKRLGVSEAMVSRDESNEYHGITVERAQRVAKALGKKLETVVTDSPTDVESRQSVAV